MLGRQVCCYRSRKKERNSDLLYTDSAIGARGLLGALTVFLQISRDGWFSVYLLWEMSAHLFQSEIIHPSSSFVFKSSVIASLEPFTIEEVVRTAGDMIPLIMASTEGKIRIAKPSTKGLSSG